MQVRQSVLANGLRAVTARLPGFDSAAVAVVVASGSRDETDRTNGIAHFLEHMAFKGTTSRSALRISAEIEGLGSHINAMTSRDTTAYFVTGLSRNMPQAIAIIGDVLTNSVYAPADIETEKGVILQEIKRSHDDPGSLANSGFWRAAYPDQALGRSILGPAETVSAFTRDDFTGFVDAHYFAQNMVIVGTGDIDHDEFIAHAQTHFAAIPSRNATVHHTPASWQGGVSRDTTARFEQVTMILGLPSVPETDPRVHAHKLLASAIGGGMSSRLFQEVREKRGLVYSIGCGSVHGADYSSLIVHAGTTAEHIEEVITVSCAELARAARRIEPEDLNRARNAHLVGIATVKERPFALANYLAGSWIEHGRVVEPDELKQGVERVTMDDLTEAAAMVVRGSPSLSLVGPAPDSVSAETVRAAMV